MADRRVSRDSLAVRRAWAAAVLALLPAVAVAAAEPSPFMRITAWQMDKLRGTEFATHPIRKKDDAYVLIRRIKSGEEFERVAQSYCGVAGLDAEKCKQVVVLAEHHHAEVHWHKNWQPNDEIYFLVPREVYEPPSSQK